MKKLLLSIGALAAVVAPVASVIACASDDDGKTTLTKPDDTARETAIAKLKELSHYDTMSSKEKATADADLEKMTLEEINTHIKEATKDNSEITEVPETLAVDLALTKTAEEIKDVILHLASKSANDLNTELGITQTSSSKIFVSGDNLEWDEATSTLTSKSTNHKIAYKITPITSAIKLTGTNGEGVLTVDTTLPKGVTTITADKKTQLKNGDEVTLTINLARFNAINGVLGGPITGTIVYKVKGHSMVQHFDTATEYRNSDVKKPSTNTNTKNITNINVISISADSDEFKTTLGTFLIGTASKQDEIVADLLSKATDELNSELLADGITNAVTDKIASFGIYLKHRKTTDTKLPSDYIIIAEINGVTEAKAISYFKAATSTDPGTKAVLDFFSNLA